MPDEIATPLGTRRGVYFPSPGDLAIIRSRANLFPIGSVEREETVDAVMNVMRTAKSRRHRLAAVKCLAALQLVNIKEFEVACKVTGCVNESEVIVNVGVNGNATISAGAVVREAANDPKYVEYLEHDRLETDRVASSLRWVNGPRLADDSSPQQDQPTPDAGGSEG